MLETKWSRRIGLTVIWVVAPPKEKAVNNQLNIPRASNSDAIVGCVAMTSELSELPTKVPLIVSMPNAPCSLVSAKDKGDMASGLTDHQNQDDSFRDR